MSLCLSLFLTTFFLALYVSANGCNSTATEIFKAIQNAHQTLSTPHERAYYDAHRNEILAANRGEEVEKDTQLPNLWQYFSTKCYKGFDDSADGFYTVFSRAFDSIVSSEKSSDPMFTAPGFGGTGIDSLCCPLLRSLTF
jgi:DnaJ-class molecular chaperone